MSTVKINTALDLQRQMIRYWQTDVGSYYAVGCSEVARYANTPDLLPELWNVAGDEDRVALAAALTHKTQIATTYWTHSDMVQLTYRAAQGRPGGAIHMTDMPHMHGFAVFEQPMIVDMGNAGLPRNPTLKNENAFDEFVGEVLDAEELIYDAHTDGIEDYSYRIQELGDAEENNVNLAAFQWNHGQVNGVPGVEVILYSDPRDKRDGLINYMQKGAKASAFRRTPPLLLLGAFFIPYAEDFAEDDVWHSIVATWWHLITQPLISTSVIQATPQMTKKAQKVDLKPNISIITLRPRKPNPKESNDNNHKIVNWSHRWLVGAEDGGTWRNQWYPSLGIHKLIHIAVYEKGPLDKPLVIARKRIYAWRR